MNGANFIQVDKGFTIDELKEISRKADALAAVTKDNRAYTRFIRLSEAAFLVRDLILPFEDS